VTYGRARVDQVGRGAGAANLQQPGMKPHSTDSTQEGHAGGRALARNAKPGPPPLI